MRRLPANVALLAALALALPASALGQGAGDEQYRDPFAGQQPENSQPQAPPDSGSETTTGPPGVAQPSDDAAAAQVEPSGQLPRTGFQGVVLLMAYGWALLIGGAALRRIA